MGAEGFRVVDPGSPSALLPEGVGGTPLIEVDGIYAKLECPNPCGSIKDRLASYVIAEARRSGALMPGQRIVEATSGNTGIAIAYFGRRSGHPVTIVMPEHMTNERKDAIRALGADLILCSKEGSFAEAAAIRDRICEEEDAFNANQFANPLNVECHFRTTGAEIVRQLAGEVRFPAAFVAGVGTGGTLIGAGAALRDAWGNVHIVAVEPEEAAVMTGGANGPHGIFGIGDGFIPDLATDGGQGTHPMIDEVEVVATEDALGAARELSEEYGLCVGVSSGANFVSARRLKGRFPTVATVFADGFQKYLSTGLPDSDGSRCPFRPLCEAGELQRVFAGIEPSPPSEG